MAQVWIEIDDNDNCGYFPIQVFEARGDEIVAQSVVIDHQGPHRVVGWEDGQPSNVQVVPVGDSGAGESLLVYGGNNGIRMRPADSLGPWSDRNPDEFGEPYLLLASGTPVDLCDSARG